ncbi:hypothetical protein [Nocardia asiatica]|uniref:hypothetical protein n=1 Tax=Nocardia asiatica TaxID=209252 RepID=UPI003EE3FD80
MIFTSVVIHDRIRTSSAGAVTYRLAAESSCRETFDSAAAWPRSDDALPGRGMTDGLGLPGKAARRATPRHIRDSMSFCGDEPYGQVEYLRVWLEQHDVAHMLADCCRRRREVGDVDGWRAEIKMRAGRGEICSSGYARDMTEADRGHRALNQPYPDDDREAELYAPISEEGPDLLADRDVRESASAIEPELS